MEAWFVLSRIYSSWCPSWGYIIPGYLSFCDVSYYLWLSLRSLFIIRASNGCHSNLFIFFFIQRLNTSIRVGGFPSWSVWSPWGVVYERQDRCVPLFLYLPVFKVMSRSSSILQRWPMSHFKVSLWIHGLNILHVFKFVAVIISASLASGSQVGACVQRTWSGALDKTLALPWSRKPFR